MKVAIVLGYYLNDDGTPRQRLINRLELTLDMIKDLNPDKIIVSGGIANKKAGVSEAIVMGKWLIEHNVSKDKIIYEYENSEKIIYEEKSGSTRGNAIYSMPLAFELNPDLVILVSTMDHFVDQPYNTIAYFNDMFEDKNINFIIYTKTKTEKIVEGD